VHAARCAKAATTQPFATLQPAAQWYGCQWRLERRHALLLTECIRSAHCGPPAQRTDMNSMQTTPLLTDRRLETRLNGVPLPMSIAVRHSTVHPCPSPRLARRVLSCITKRLELVTCKLVVGGFSYGKRADFMPVLSAVCTQPQF